MANLLYTDPTSGFEYPNGAVAYCTPLPWRQLSKVANCPCTDGVRRTAQITGTPATFFSVPARVKVRGVTVTGFVATMDNAMNDREPGPEFYANASGKNAHMLPRDHAE